MKTQIGILKKSFFLIVVLTIIFISIGHIQTVSASTHNTSSVNTNKKYTVSFYTASGKKYKALQQIIPCGKYITVPDVPSGRNSVGIYWTNGKNGPRTNAGDKVKLKSNLRFYRVSIPKYIITLCTTDGTKWKTITTTGKTKFPSAAIDNGDMVLGWSTSKNKSKKPAYYANDIIPRKNAAYYMVTYKKSQNRKVSLKKTSKYDKIWFVGDSRTLGMKKAIGKSAPSINIKFICKGGAGIRWLKDFGYSQLTSQIIQTSKSQKKAVIINLGVNDLYSYSGYSKYMRKIAQELSSYNCDMYYMSINPVNSAVIKKYHGKRRTEKQINEINNEIFFNLCTGPDKCYTYIDSYEYLCQNGWTCNERNDGVHYSPETYKKIYNYTIGQIG